MGDGAGDIDGCCASAYCQNLTCRLVNSKIVEGEGREIGAGDHGGTGEIEGDRAGTGIEDTSVLNPIPSHQEIVGCVDCSFNKREAYYIESRRKDSEVYDRAGCFVDLDGA